MPSWRRGRGDGDRGKGKRKGATGSTIPLGGGQLWTLCWCGRKRVVWESTVHPSIRLDRAELAVGMRQRSDHMRQVYAALRVALLRG